MAQTQVFINLWISSTISFFPVRSIFPDKSSFIFERKETASIYELKETWI